MAFSSAFEIRVLSRSDGSFLAFSEPSGGVQSASRIRKIYFQSILKAFLPDLTFFTHSSDFLCQSSATGRAKT